jgi:acetyl-CoA synthetase
LQGESVETALARYKHDYAQSLTNPDTFWREQADVHLSWSQKFTEVTQGSFDDGDVRWFSNGKLNACYNCVDRHVEENGDRLAIIWEGDEPGDERKITYAELQKEVSRMANVMKANGVKKGDLVTIYSPMIPEVCVIATRCMLHAACDLLYASLLSDWAQ